MVVAALVVAFNRTVASPEAPLQVQVAAATVPDETFDPFKAGVPQDLGAIAAAKKAAQAAEKAAKP